MRIPEWVPVGPRVRLPPAAIGGKGGGLVALARIPGVRVPPACILTTRFFERVLASMGLGGSLARWRHALRRGDRRESDSLARVIRSRLMRPGEHVAAIVRTLERARRELRRRAARPFLWIVRSSATIEDTSRSSAAGRYRSVPAVDDPRALAHGVVEVWASLFSPGSSSGSHRPSMAVILQEHVAAAASGMVMTEGGEVWVEAIRGLGEPLASGRVNPSRWRFDAADSALLQRTVSPQGEQRILLPSGRTTDRRLVSGTGRPPLPDSRAREVASQAARASQALGYPVDIEFACDARGVLHLVQCRPKTGAPLHNPDGRASVSARSGNGVRRVKLGGITASPGAVAGRLVLIDRGDARDPEGANLPAARRILRAGDILVTPTVNLGWVEWFGQLGGVVAERGGILSHTATLARERGMPAVVGAAALIRRLRVRFKKRIRPLGPGAWKLEGMTLDADRGLVFEGRLPVRPGSKARFRRSPTGYSRRRSEWAHFVDGRGRDWTGKPEYRLTPLQFDLYRDAWKIAFERAGISETEIPIRVSVVTPDASLAGGRRMGRIRPGDETLSGPDEYRVVAFPTATLSQIGDRILGPLQRGRAGVSRLIRRLHRERKAAFRHWAAVTRELERRGDAFRGFGRLFRAYSTSIAFAHLRATFRRRVAGPLLDRAFASLPKAAADPVECALLAASLGLGTEASHGRNAAVYRLLNAADGSGLRDPLTRRSPADALSWIRRRHPDFFDRLLRCAEAWKLDRSQKDLLEAEPPLEGWMRMIQDWLRSPPAEGQVGRAIRTWKGFVREVDHLRVLIARHDESFDFASFREAVLMAWEIPGLTEYERHLQHRCQSTTRKALVRMEERMHRAGILPRKRLAFDCGRSEFLEILARLRARRPGGQSSTGGPAGGRAGP